MDCLRAAELVSAAADGELVDAAELAEARQHCTACPECAPLTQLLGRLETAPAPRAPQQLVAQLETLAARAAAEAAEDEAASRIVTELPVRHRRSWEWTPRFTALASAAAVLLIALTAGSVALLSQQPQEASDTAAPTLLKDSSEMATPEVGAAQDSTASRGVVAAAPGYVVFDGIVWAQVTLPSTAALNKVGAVTSDLGSGTTSDHSAYTGDAPDVLYVQSDGPEVLAFRPVVRTIAGTAYALSSDVPITAFGSWPTLPQSIPQPQNADGSPTFVRWGFDDSNRDVFTLRTGSIRDGIAIAPGTPVDDPAAGNPNWTWWQQR